MSLEMIWVTAQPRDPATGLPVTVRLAGGGSYMPFYRDGQHYRAGLVRRPRFTQKADFGEDGWTGGTTPQTSKMPFKPADPALLDELLGYYWRDALIAVDVGPEGGPYERLLTGIVVDAPGARDGVLFEIADLSQGANKPVATGRFAGTGGIEGGNEAANRTKRRSWGRVFNIEGRVLDKANNIFEFGDPAFPIQEFTAVRDMGRAASPAPTLIAWQGTAAATLVALVAATPAQGSCAIAPSICCVKWWTQPAGPLTADIKGEIGTGYVEKAPEIAARLLAAANGPTIDNVAAMAVARPAPAGLHLGDANETAAAALDRLLFGVSLLWSLNPAGTIQLREITFIGPVETLVSIDQTRKKELQPIKARRVAYQVAQRIHTDGEISAALLINRGAWAAGVSYIAGELVIDGESLWAARTDHVSAVGNRPPTLPATSNATWQFAGNASPEMLETILNLVEAAGAAANDNILTGSDKAKIVIPLLNTLDAACAQVLARGTSLGISTAALVAAKGAIYSYFDNFKGANWRNTDVDTVLSVEKIGAAFPGGWGQNGTVGQVASGPYWTLTDDSSGAYEYLVSDNMAAVAGQTYTSAFVFKKDAVLPTTRTPLLRILEMNGTGQVADLQLDSRGAGQLASGGVAYWAVLDLSDTEALAIVSRTAGAGVTLIRMDIAPAIGTSAGYSPATTGSLTVRNPTTVAGSSFNLGADLYRALLYDYRRQIDLLNIEINKAIVAGLDATEFFDPMSYATIAEFQQNWDCTSGHAAKLSVVSSNDTDGRAIQAGDNSGDDYFAALYRRWMPYNPEDLYEVAYDIENQAAGPSTVFYLGVAAEDRAGNNLGSSFNYVAAAGSGTAANLGRRVWRGYFRGTANVTGAALSPNRDNPGALPDGTVAGHGQGGAVRVRPVMLLNYNDDPGRVVIHSVSIRKVVDATMVPRGAWSGSTEYFQDDGVTYQGRTFGAKLKHTNQAPPTTATSNTYWYLIADKGADGNKPDVKFIRSLSTPSTPTGDDPSGWSDGVPPGTDTLWMSRANKTYGGTLIGGWSTPESLSGSTPRGPYSGSETYYLNNFVTHEGGTYIAVQSNFSGQAPSGTAEATAYWDVVAAPGAPGEPGTPPSAFSATIDLTSSAGTVNLRTIADANGYTGLSDATITFRVPNAVTIRGLTNGSGISTGTWPTGSYTIALTLVIQSGGIVEGGGGRGGAGGSGGNGSAGNAGGHGVSVLVPMTGGITINSGGALRGGGGGGAGGDGATTGGTEPFQYGGGGGGGGAPNGGGGGGGEGDISARNGTAGSSGTTGGGGGGGSDGGAGADGGAGGGYATAGTSSSGQSGGAAGKAVSKNGNTVTVTNNGTMVGAAS